MASGLLAVLAFGPNLAFAATLGTCTIVVASSGVLKPSPTLTTLGTTNPGGSAGRATITASAGGAVAGALCTLGQPFNCMQVSVSAPTSFSSAPASGNTNVTLSSTFNQVGSSSLVNLLNLVILNGSYTFDFNLTATKSAGIFGAGNYQAQEIIRCE